MSNIDTIQDVVLSLTGYDEIAIEKAFGTEVESLSPQKQPRALAFVLFRREGMTDPEAKDASMAATQREVLEKFGVDADELFPDEPETEQGKDGSPADDGPKS